MVGSVALLLFTHNFIIKIHFIDNSSRLYGFWLQTKKECHGSARTFSFLSWAVNVLIFCQTVSLTKRNATEVCLCFFEPLRGSGTNLRTFREARARDVTVRLRQNDVWKMMQTFPFRCVRLTDGWRGTKAILARKNGYFT